MPDSPKKQIKLNMHQDETPFGKDDTIRVHSDEEDFLFKKDFEKRYKVDKHKRTLIVLIILTVVVYFVTILLPNGMDSNNVHVSLAWWMEILQQNVADFTSFISGGPVKYMNLISVRFLIVAVVGAALAVSGAVYQGSFRNGLVSPSTLGVQTGGVMGGAIYVLFFMKEYNTGVTYAQMQMQYTGLNAWRRYEESLFILGGCFLAVFFVMFVSKIVGRGRMSTVALILTGMVFSSVVSGVIGLVQYWLLLTDTYGNKTTELRYMMMGTFSRVTSWQHLAMIGIPVVIALIIIMSLRSQLNVITFGDEEARTMGINVEKMRWILVIVVTALTALVIAFCGRIGFIGFLIPHITRRFIGPDFRYLIPGSALFGAILMMIVYYVGTLINYADNINFLTSIIGGGVFLVMLVVYRRRSNADWA